VVRCIAIAVALAAVVCAAGAARGTGALSGRITFSATGAPSNDDVMLARTDGTMLDLSASPAVDTLPAVSPNGKLVAFYSTRGGAGAEWVVGIDGKGLRKITPALSGPSFASWSPNSRDLVLQTQTLRRARVTGGIWVRLNHRGHPQSVTGWSPDGKTIAYTDGLGGVEVVTPTGRLVHDYAGLGALWSPTGRLAVLRDSATMVVYSAAGRKLASFASTFAGSWSAGGRLATVTPTGVLQIRRGGVGRPVLSARPVRHARDVRWADEQHVLVRGDSEYLVYDVAHRKAYLAPAAYRIRPALARDGSAFAESPYGTLVHATLSGSTRKVTAVPHCQGRNADAFAWLQALPDASGAVYAGDCVASHDLFSVAPDGTGLARLTATSQDEIDAAVSADGSRIAFARAETAGCAGCDRQIWISAPDGSDAKSVTLPSDASIHTDDRPSFSPDGTKLSFARWDAAVTGDTAGLAVAPATGGMATLLPVSGGNPAWGPQRIAFDSVKGDVETIAPDGTGATPVPNTRLLDGGVPAWSADGRLAILRVEPLTIYLPAADEVIPLRGLHQAVGPAPGLAWSPDGTRFAFTAADANGEGDVWTIGADGGGLTRVTNGLVADGGLSWR
jgi:Tol biopolymer transport system component